jgi:PKD repeat protein
LVQFTDTSIGHPQTWAWDFGDGSTSTEQNPVHTYTVTDPNLPQTFTVTLTVTGWGQTSSLSKDIVIWPPVVADFTADKTEGEAGLIVQFTDLSTGQVSKWHWDFGDGTSSDERNPQHTFMNPGKYDVTLFVEREAEPHSVDPKTLPIYIRVGPEVMTDFTATPTTVATGVEVQFTDLSTSADPVVSWSWDFGDGSILEGTDPAVHKNPRHAYTAADTYTVTLTAENQYRKKTMTKVGYITVYPAVVASFTADHTAAPIGGLISFTDTSTESPTSWSWDFGDGTIEVIQNPSHTYTAAGVYSVTLTASNAYSTSPPKTRIDYITVFEPVTAAFTADPLEGSTPLTVTFTDGSTGDVDTWSWDFNGDNVADSDLEAPSYTFSAAGDHVVTLTAWNKLRPDLTSTASATIKVDSLPTASFTTSTSSGSRPLSVTFTDTSSGNPVSWSWDFDGNGTVDDTTRSPTHTYATADTYTVRLTVSNQAGGSSPATTTIVVT